MHADLVLSRPRSEKVAGPFGIASGGTDRPFAQGYGSAFSSINKTVQKEKKEGK
jgi:hypothetical protein